MCFLFWKKLLRVSVGRLHTWGDFEQRRRMFPNKKTLFCEPLAD
jgi:hypothetical protein